MKNKKIIHVILIIMGAFFLSLSFTSCSSGSGIVDGVSEEAKHESEDDHGEEIVILSDKELKEFGIEVQKAESGQLERHVDMNGEIVIIPDRMAHIIPRFPGVVKEVRKKIGSSVSKGEVLAIIESNESLAPYKVRSLINGKVIDMHLTLGEVIGNDGHSFIVADLSKVWINLSVYQKDLNQIKEGQKAFVFNRPSGKTKEGVISYISPVVDEKTRTATARIVLDNVSGNWKPGLFVYAKVIVGLDSVPVMVPKTAIENYENRTVIFVKHEDGFVPKAVTLGRSNTNFIEIKNGLKPGEIYVSKGGFTLKAELQKDALDDDHGH
jgi:cobalt-zinc-cadmium efflux system membrane fusion protein